MRSTLAAIVIALVACAVADAQFRTPFENPPYVTVPGGAPLVGQDGWFLPVQGGTPFNVWAYADPNSPVAANPQGNQQFIAGISQGTNLEGRAERMVTWPNTGKWTVWYDAAAVYDVTGGPANNVGSFSPRPFVGGDTRNTYIHLFSFQTIPINDPNQAELDPNHYRAYFLTYLNGQNNYGETLGGFDPGPAWELLEFNKWYRHATTLDFTSNTIIKVRIIDLAAQAGATADTTLDPNYPADWYLEGEGAGSAGPPQAVRFFAGSPSLMTTGWDNFCLAPGVGTGDLNCDGVIDFGDINPFVMLLSDPAGYQAAFPNCCVQNGDCNLDGVVDFGDINPFVALLSGGS